MNILKRIQWIEESLQEVKRELEKHDEEGNYYVGQLYQRKGFNNLYALIDYNGVIRLLNITHSTYWKSDDNMLKSSSVAQSRKIETGKCISISTKQMAQVLGKSAKPEDFELIEQLPIW